MPVVAASASALYRSLLHGLSALLLAPVSCWSWQGVGLHGANAAHAAGLSSQVSVCSRYPVQPRSLDSDAGEPRGDRWQSPLNTSLPVSAWFRSYFAVVVTFFVTLRGSIPKRMAYS